MCKRSIGGRRLTLLPILGILILVPGVRAEDAAECGPWTWLPDFRCDDYAARPDDAFQPVGMPYLFEDPYITSGLNFVYIYHRLPDGNDTLADVVFDGGELHVLALQARLALTENLAFIATKDGLGVLRPGGNALVEKDTGSFDITAGFKYKLFETEARDFVLTPALRYEIPMGSAGIFQGFGDGVLIPSASFRWGLGRLGLEHFNIVGSLGGQVPIDGNANSGSLFYNLHLDYGIKVGSSIVEYVVPFLEFNGIHYTNSGNGMTPVHLRGVGHVKLPLPFEGFDVANLGSPGIDGNDVLVMGGGFRVPTSWGVSFAVMYEGPITNREDIHNQRFTFMVTWEL